MEENAIRAGIPAWLFFALLSAVFAALTNIFGKVGVSSRLELALFARDHRILTTTTLSDCVSAPQSATKRLLPRKPRDQNGFDASARESGSD